MPTHSTHLHRPRYRPPSFLTALAMAGWLAVSGAGGCAPAPEVTAPSFAGHGALITREALVVVPDHNWSRHPERSSWVFRGSATLRFEVRRPLTAPLSLHLRTDGDTLRHRFRLSWDGQPLEGLPQRPPADGFDISIPSDALGPGSHHLEVRRLYRGEPQPVHDNTFETLGYRLGEQEQLLSADGLEDFRLLGDFLDVGVTGPGRVKRGGTLFLGDAQHAEPVPAGAEFLQAHVENRSSSASNLTVAFGTDRRELHLAAGARQPVRLAVPPGSRSLRLAVDGAAGGMVLWGEPHWVRPSLAKKRPPVFLITLDTTRRDVLSPYGAPEETSPHLAAFAERATVFENAYSTSPWTLPSHASMMTGLYPSRHGAGVSSQFLPGHLPTLAALLRGAGYFTAGFAGGSLCAHRYGVGQGFHRYTNPLSFETPGDHMTAELEALLRQRSSQDLFVFANYFDPHALYQAPEEFEERMEVPRHRAALAGKPIWQAFDGGSAGAWRRIIDGEATAPTAALRDYMWASYRAEVAFMDHQIGRLVALLEELGLFEPALIILIADHGELLGEYGGLFSHAGRLDPELTEIPLIVKWPEQKEGERVDALVSQVDVLATVLEAVGLPVPPQDGRPLPRRPSERNEDRRLLFLEEHESRVHPLPPRLRLAPHVYGLQWPARRQVVWKGGGECAHRLGEDWAPEICDPPAERLLDRILKTLGETATTRDAGQLTEEERENLKALGYL